MTKWYCAIIASALLMQAVSCSRFRDPAVATVDGEKVTASELRAEMNMERGKYDAAILSRGANLGEFRRRALDKLIQESVLLAEAKRLSIKANGAKIREIGKMREGVSSSHEGDAAISERGIDPDAWRDAQRRRLVIQKLVRQEAIDKIPVPEEKVAEYYRSHIQEFNLPTQFHARQILVDTREQADEILAKLKAGADFAGLAKEHSVSPDGKRGGDLGYFDSRAYPEAFSEVCQQLKPGEVSDVVATDYGFQIFELLDRRPARHLSPEEAAERIRQRFKDEKSETAIKEWSDALMAKAKVAIDEEVLKGVTIEGTK